jgi:hypothetical protein
MHVYTEHAATFIVKDAWPPVRHEAMRHAIATPKQIKPFNSREFFEATAVSRFKNETTL